MRSEMVQYFLSIYIQKGILIRFVDFLYYGFFLSWRHLFIYTILYFQYVFFLNRFIERLQDKPSDFKENGIVNSLTRIYLLYQFRDLG